jgi:hypothetical protein
MTTAFFANKRALLVGAAVSQARTAAAGSAVRVAVRAWAKRSTLRPSKSGNLVRPSLSVRWPNRDHALASVVAA